MRQPWFPVPVIAQRAKRSCNPDSQMRVIQIRPAKKFGGSWTAWVLGLILVPKRDPNEHYNFHQALHPRFGNAVRCSW